LKVASIVGARPQFVKASVVSRELRAAGISEFLVHTGQHYDDKMSRIFFDELEIPRPKYNLGIGSASHGVQTGRMLEAIEQVLMEEQPDWTLVYGDTNSTLAGVLAAVKMQIQVAHVEAGLRSFNRGMPEEINRLLTDHAADLLFAPTTIAVNNLQREGVADHRIRLVGDVMYDGALFYADKAGRQSRVLERFSLEPKQYVLATVHRAENTDHSERLRAICSAFAQLSQEITIVFPVHPRTRKALAQTLALNDGGGNFLLIDPVGYLDMIVLEKHAALVATDSGGVQKEAFFYGVGSVTLRDETEWVELVELGWNRVVPPVCPAMIVEGVRAGLAAPPGQPGQPYGDGRSSQLIARTLLGSGL
jgi:UDP-GlcNAc3NAcA epimerase